LERSGEGASGVAECGGDVGFPCQTQGSDGEVSEAGHDTGTVEGAYLGGVFVVGDVADVAQFVLDAAVFAGVDGKLRGIRSGGVAACGAKDRDGACFLGFDVGDVALNQKCL
jgi:hypothetical protein